MNTFIRLTAPVNKLDFILKLAIFVMICGALNHLRHILVTGFPWTNSYWISLAHASFTALPMCAFALLLIGRQYDLQQRLTLQATQDSLTGLKNRRWFIDNTPQTPPVGAAMMMIDVDHFKTVNDAYGHEVGDECLCAIADHVRASIKPMTVCARIGGEEFAAYDTNVSPGEIYRISQALSDGFKFQSRKGQSWHITMSVGVTFCDGALSRSDTLRLADEALYTAKSKGRACYELIAAPSSVFPPLTPPAPPQAPSRKAPLRRIFSTT